MHAQPLMKTSMAAGALALSLCALPALAQQAPAGARVTASEAGKAAVADVVTAAAVVTAIDKGSRSVTLKTASGESVDVIAGDDVRNFDQIKVGDQVVVRYARALTLELKKSGAPLERKDSAGEVRSKPGEKPGGAVARQVTVMTKVVDVNPKAKTISLQGPKGNVMVLDVKNPEHFKVVKKGDNVEAVYTEALAISVEPATKKK